MTSRPVRTLQHAEAGGRSRYLGLRCDSVNLEGLRCEREAGHAEIRGRVGQLHRADGNGAPAVWSDRR